MKKNKNTFYTQFQITKKGLDVLGVIELLIKDKHFNIHEPFTFPFIEDVHSELNGDTNLSDVINMLIEGGIIK